MSDNPIPLDLRSDYLFLLLGENPLPNWVAARLLLKEGGQIYLIHSPHTQEVARRLQTILADPAIQDAAIQAERYEVPEADESEIYRRVSNWITPLIKSGKGTVGLNYTGGTKIMSVHAHRAFNAMRSEIQQAGRTLPLSYLDARTLRMKFDGGPRDGYRVGLASDVRIKLDTLLRLHEDFPSQPLPFQTRAIGVSAAQGLVAVHRYYQGQNTWRRWCDKFLKAAQNRFHPATTLNAVRLPTQSEFQDSVTNAFKNIRSNILTAVVTGYDAFLAGLNANTPCTLSDVAPNNSFQDSRQFAEWLDGKWLEHYTFDQIEACAANAYLNPQGVALNLEPKNREEREFEADVVALRGYQLFYFTCYAGSDRGRAKLKLFEAMTRATQLGGDEALIALVSCVDNNETDDLRREVESDWAATGRVQVYGRNDLGRLSGKLQNWFNRSGHM